MNYEGIAKKAAEYIAEKMKEKMIDENYSTIHKAAITLDFENEIMTVETERKDPLGIPFKASVSVEI